MDEVTKLAVAKAIDDSAELTTAAQTLAAEAIRVATYYLTSGAPAMKMQVIKALMPAIGRSLTERAESEEINEMRKEVDSLYKAVLGQTA